MPSRSDRKTYDFKSVGEINFEVEARRIIKEPQPIGIATPMTLGGDKALWKMHTDLHRSIADNLRNLILTNWGERLGTYYFGANIMELVFELAKEDIAQEAMKRIKMATKKFMPFVSLAGFVPEIEHWNNKEVAKIAVVITYTVPKIDNKLKAVRIMLYVGG